MDRRKQRGRGSESLPLVPVLFANDIPVLAKIRLSILSDEPQFTFQASHHLPQVSDLAITVRAGSGNLNRGVEWIIRATSA